MTISLMEAATTAAAEARVRFGEPGLFHFHRNYTIEFYYDLRADTWGGPRTFHGVGWVCACGRAVDGGTR